MATISYVCIWQLVNYLNTVCLSKKKKLFKHWWWWQVIQENSSSEIEQVKLPFLVYVSREKKPSHPHHFKAGALNVLVRFFLSLVLWKAFSRDITQVWYSTYWIWNSVNSTLYEVFAKILILPLIHLTKTETNVTQISGVLLNEAREYSDQSEAALQICNKLFDCL